MTPDRLTTGMTIEGRSILITGANRGIGREIVRELAGKGITTILAARDKAKADAAARDLAGVGQILPRELDVTDPGSVQRLADSVTSEFGQLDVLVNNAGVLLDAQASALNVDLIVEYFHARGLLAKAVRQVESAYLITIVLTQRPYHQMPTAEMMPKPTTATNRSCWPGRSSS